MRPKRSIRHAFTLIELAMVIAVSGLMVGFVLKTNQSQSYSDSECANITKGQLIYIQGAIERFARSNDRLPLPARRFVGTDGPTYGREAVAGQLTVAGGVTFGALPWQALQLPASFAGDCWGNKYTYMVTTALTTNDAVTGYLKDTVKGNIARKTSSTVTADTEIAYAIISHGPDKLGAVKLNYDDSAGAMDRKWCTGSTDIAYTNCLATAAIVMDAPLNDGKDASTAYFDDIVRTAGKPKILSSAAASNAYCWGYNAEGQIGDGTIVTPVKQPTLVTGNIQFAQLTTGQNHTCGLDRTGKAYCWGDNTYGQLGDGTSGVGAGKKVPTAVSGGLTFSQIRAGYYETCALRASDGAAYCWGYGASLVGYGGTPNTVPAAVTGGLTFSDITAGFTYACGIRSTNGAGYCWGYNESGQLGVGDSTDRTAGPVPINGGLTLRKIYGSARNSCAITTAGDAYCWGDDTYGQLGNGAPRTASYDPVPVSGGLKFQSLAMGQSGVCGLTTSNVTYCWGRNDNNDMGTGSVGVGYYETPQPQASPQTFIQISRHNGGGCGLTSDYRVYCWGRNNAGQAGDDSTTERSAPTLTYNAGTSPNTFGSLAFNGYGVLYHSCALQPLPPAAWGANDYGHVGDGTTTTRTTPVYVTMPTGVNYFKTISDGYTRCALSDTGAAYCWGNNASGQIGNGNSGGTVLTPTAATMPSGVTFTSIYGKNNNASCAIGHNNRPYCWGVGYYYGYNGSPKVPTLLPIPPTTVDKISLFYGGGTYIGSNGLPYQSNGWSGIAAATLPGILTSAKGYEIGHGLACMLGNDDQIYCGGESGAYSAIGDGSTSKTDWNLVPVTPPSGVTSYKSLGQGISGGGWTYACAIGNDNEGYCWGYGNIGVLGNGTSGAYYVPTKVTRPAGVNYWLQIKAAYDITIYLGDDGNWYFSGIYNMGLWDTGARTYTPTKLPLPPGASGWRYVDGRIGIPY